MLRLPLGSIVLLVLVGTAASICASVQPADLDAHISAAFRAAYNLDQDQALASARAAVTSAPDESRAHRALAAILWIDIIFRRGAVTVDHYLGGVTKSKLTLPKPPPALDAEFKQELGHAIELATHRLRSRPNDVPARYDLGAAYGLQASYVASVEGSVASAFMSARRAFDAQEEVLSRDPRLVGAGVVVGTYRYVVAGLALPSRVLAYMMGFGGDKERAIRILQDATQDPAAHVEAKLALVLIFSREGRHAEASRLLADLAAEFPRNRIFVLEQGSSSIRAGKAAEAEVVLTRGLDMFDHDDRRKIPGERGLWLYKRGLSRLSQNHPAEAAADFGLALESGPEDWVRGRIRLALGKVADLGGRRSQALDQYRQARDICGAANDPACTTEAGRWLRERFVMPPRS